MSQLPNRLSRAPRYHWLLAVALAAPSCGDNAAHPAGPAETLDQTAVADARDCARKEGWRGAAGRELLLDHPRSVQKRADGKVQVSFAERPADDNSNQDPDGIEVLVDPRTATCERLAME